VAVATRQRLSRLICYRFDLQEILLFLIDNSDRQGSDFVVFALTLTSAKLAKIAEGPHGLTFELSRAQRSHSCMSAAAKGYEA